MDVIVVGVQETIKKIGNGKKTIQNVTATVLKKKKQTNAVVAIKKKNKINVTVQQITRINMKIKTLIMAVSTNHIQTILVVVQATITDITKIILVGNLKRVDRNIYSFLLKKLLLCGKMTKQKYILRN